MKITYQGVLTRDDVVKTLKLHHQPKLFGIIIRIILASVVIAVYLVTLQSRMPVDLSEEARYLLPVGLVLYWISSPIWIPYSKATRFIAKTDYQSAITGTITEDGITIETSRSESKLDWAEYTRAIIREDIVLIYQENNFYNPFHKDFFADDDLWNAFINLVKEKVPDHQR